MHGSVVFGMFYRRIPYNLKQMNPAPTKYQKYYSSDLLPMNGHEPDRSRDIERMLEAAANSRQTDNGGVFAVSRTGEAFEFTKVGKRPLNRLN